MKKQKKREEEILRSFLEEKTKKIYNFNWSGLLRIQMAGDKSKE